MLTITVTGTLGKDPIGSESYTLWKVKSLGSEVTIFSSDSAEASRAAYSAGDRVRGEGRGGWNEFNDSFALQLSGAAVDGSEAGDDLTIKVDGSIPHELKVEQDSADEGGGRYIPIEIEAPTRGRDRSGNWEDQIAYVRAMVLGPAVDRLLELDKAGVTSLCFKGALDADACFIKGEPSYYAEITEVEPSQGRGGNDDAFWASKPKGLAAKRAAMKAKPAAPKPPAQPKKKPGGGGSGGPSDDLPFMYEWR